MADDDEATLVKASMARLSAVSRRFAKLTLGLVAAGIALGAAACGGSSSRSYDAAATRACLIQSGVVRELIDQRMGVGQAASLPSGSSWHGYVGQTHLGMAVLRTAEDAKSQVALGHLYAGEIGAGPLIYDKGNAVLAWVGTPTGADRKAVEGCLSTSD